MRKTVRKYLLFIYLIFVSCSQTFLEETQNAVFIKAKVSYNTLDTGILLEWETQWDFARVEVLRGMHANSLSVFRDKLAQNTLLDTESISGQDTYYQIQAFNSKNRLIGQSDVYKGLRSYKPYDQIIEPTNLKTYIAQYSDKIEIFWTGNSTDVFRVYRSVDVVGVFTKIAEVAFNFSEELKYIDYKVDPGSHYFYKVSSIGKDSDGVIKEKLSTGSPLEGSTKIAPKGVKAISTVGGIALSWDNDIFSDYYQVYRSETEEKDYELVVPFVKNAKYTDYSLPNFTGTVVDGVWTYPSYYYKIKSFSKGQESGFSTPIVGQAIDPADFLPASELNIRLDNSVYPYQLILSWKAIDHSAVTYRLSKIDNKNVTNIIIDNTSLLEYTIPNEEFGSQYEFVLQALNNNIGNLPGEGASTFYTSSTPAPPVIATISTNARVFITNTSEVNVESHVYWGSDTSMVGTVKKEWLITSIVGNIDLTWDKQISSEYIDYYTIYRRKKGTTKFEVLKDNLTSLAYSDISLTKSELQGSGVGIDFVYPFYEYQITATFAGQQSAPSIIESGSAINPSDILPAPEYVSIPAHWADGNGFGGAKWAKGPLSPKGVEKVVGLGGANHMYLTWGDVTLASTYRVRHSRGSAQENWIENSEYPADGTKKDSVQWFNNETTTESMTGLYVFSDWLGYSVENASFDVGSINGATGNLLGDVRGIWFTEPATRPAHY